MKAAIVCDSFGPTPPWVFDKLRDGHVEAVCEPCCNDADIIRVAAGAQIVWLIGGGPTFTAAALEHLPDCLAIVRSGSGVDNVPVAEATRRNIMVINTPEATAVPVAEGTCAMILAAYRRLMCQDRAMRRGEWGPWAYPPPAPLAGRTLGLVGFGHIARKVARRMAAFDMNVIASDPVVDRTVIAAAGARAVTLDELFPNADVVSLHCPLTEQTRGLVNRDRLAQMRPTAILVNTARGPIIDEAALLDALQNHTIAAAALDVFAHEPLAPDHPLRRMDNVILAPHCAGHHGGLGDEFRKLGAQSILDLAQGLWPQSCVNRPSLTPQLPLHERTALAPADA